jgi:nicotinamidase/pyrazinamidase
MKEIFFMDIDTQRDFMLPSGSLYVPGAERLIPKLRKLFDCARRQKISVLSSKDAHTPEDTEFQQFPPHCIKGTEGAQKLEETLLFHPKILENKPADYNFHELVQKYQQVIVEKQTLDVFENPVTDKVLRALPKHAFVFGVATEYCVRLAALGLRKRGVKTAILIDAIRPVASDAGVKAIDEMRRAGVEFLETQALLQAYAA